MDIGKVFEERYSTRSFSNKKVERELINKILDVNSYAPTAKNCQPQVIYVIESEESIAKLKNVMNSFDAPVVLLVCADQDKACYLKRDEYLTDQMDTSIVGTYMMLEATNLGLGTCWIRSFVSEDVRKEFNIPENIKPEFAIALGYKSEDDEPSILHTQRRSNDEMVIFI